DGIRDPLVTGVQTCALPIWRVSEYWAPIPKPSTALRKRLSRIYVAAIKSPGRLSSASIVGGSRCAFLPGAGLTLPAVAVWFMLEIGRASCRESVEVRVVADV